MVVPCKPDNYPKVGAFCKRAYICAKDYLTARLQNAPTKVVDRQIDSYGFRYVLPNLRHFRIHVNDWSQIHYRLTDSIPYLQGLLVVNWRLR